MSQQELTEHLSNLCPTMADHGYMELLWKNGQIVVQNVSNRTDKAWIHSTSKTVPEEMDHLVTTLPSEQTEMKNNQEHGMTSRLDYPFDDIYKELFPEVSGLDLDCLSLTVPADEATNYSQIEGNTHAAVNPSTSKDSARCSARPEFLSRQQRQPFMLSSRSKNWDAADRAFDQCGGNGGLPIKILQDQDPASSRHPTCSSTPLLNFVHFSRLAAEVDCNFQFMDVRSNSETACTHARRSSMEPNSVCSANHEMREVSASHGQTPTIRLPTQHAEMAVSFQNAEPICWEDDARNTSKHNGNINNTTNLRLPDNVSCHGSSCQGHPVARKNRSEKHKEPVNILPSMCSANVGVGASTSDIRNKDCEGDSGGTGKPSTRKSTSIKRRRGVGMHSISERRRRNRINEKIRALQRLIPNCTMVDKASTLNEAIEYLKTLQMQVQIMSMYRLHMMQMMLSSGTPPPICPSHASPSMGFNMGMSSGLGFGVGMLEMTAGPSMVPMPHMYPYASVPQMGLLHGMPASTNFHMFGQGPSAASIPHPTTYITPSSAVAMTKHHIPEVPEQVVHSDLLNPKDERLQTTDPAGGETSSKQGTSHGTNTYVDRQIKNV